ncbi:MAG: hypothetical protein WKF54_10280 [Nocardioidaceae bacterium]
MEDSVITVPLQMTLVDVARLAKVQRPVVSVWRSRGAVSAPAFPEPFAKVRGEERFDAGAVVEWLELTGRGNNPDARADVAAFASPMGMSAQDDEVVFNGLAALLCLKEISGERLTGLTDDDLLDLADDADPDDEFLLSEIDALGERRSTLGHYADEAADAAYHGAEAFEQLMQARYRLVQPGHTTVALHECVHELASSLAVDLAADAGLDPAVYVDPTCGGSDLLVSLVRRHEITATVMTAGHRDSASRQARRRLRVHGVHCETLTVDDDGSWAVARPAVHLAQYPSPGRPAMTAEEILSAIDNVVLQMDDTHRAVIVAPASVLSDRIRKRRADELRDVLLRHGSVRAIVRLPKGLVVTKPRQALALWVLGPAYGDVPLQDRWTMVADLTDVSLDAAAIGDLVSDLVVAMADWRTVTAHAFRFARPTLTRSLLAGGGDLVAHHPAAVRPSRVSGPELALRIADLTTALHSADTPHPGLVVEARNGAEDLVPPLALGDAVAAGQVRMIPGNRLDPADLSGGAVRVFGPEELTGAIRTGTGGIDRLAFEAGCASSRYTEPGDVVFCTSPRPCALVDADGGAVVVAPARVLRINPASSGGLVPEVLAGDVNAMPAEARAWRNWPIRRVPTTQRAVLIDALADLERQRTQALDRLALVEELTHLVTRGVASGSLALTTDIDPMERG